MNYPNSSKLNLIESCGVYSQAVQSTLATLLNIHVESAPEVEATAAFAEGEDMYFSIIFTGRVYGEFVIGINRRTAYQMLSAGGVNGHQETVDTFKEILNIAAGNTLQHLRSVCPDVSITPPRAIEGKVSAAALNLYKKQLRHPSGVLSCYIYVDQMRLDVATSLERNQMEQESLRRLNRAKTEFLANMSHELRTPLNGMIGMLDMLRSSELSEVQREHLSIIYKSGDFLLSIINDILEFSRIESGKLEIENRNFSLRESLEAVVESMAAAVFAKNLDFNVVIEESIQGQYCGDETRIKQILVNLLGNAIKFTPTGGIKVVVETNAAGWVVMRVIDTGVGIPASKLATIFDSFSQVDVSDSRKYGGSGLGLTISKSIIGLMQGRIQVKSEEAKGSEFIIELPLARAAVPSAVTSQMNEPVKIDILSNNPGNAEALRAYLPQGDVVAIEGSRLRTESDVVMIDCRTWDHTSDAVKTEILAQIQAKSVYTVFLTRPQEMQALVDQPANSAFRHYHYLNLPINRGRLLEVLRERPQFSPQKSQAAPIEASVGAERRRLLLVEDNDINRKVAKAMLAKMGYEIDVAEHGLQAVEMVRGHRYDLVLMDCQMPTMNGYEATVRIREMDHGQGGHTPIVAMTANAFRETKEQCFECGMDDFTTKPIKMEDLKNAIQRTLERFSAQQGPASTRA